MLFQKLVGTAVLAVLGGLGGCSVIPLRTDDTGVEVSAADTKVPPGLSNYVDKRVEVVVRSALAEKDLRPEGTVEVRSGENGVQIERLVLGASFAGPNQDVGIGEALPYELDATPEASVKSREDK